MIKPASSIKEIIIIIIICLELEFRMGQRLNDTFKELRDVDGN